jgi:signal peptidase II
MFIGLALAVTLFIMIWLRRLPRTGQTLLAIALSLIVGGALGNVIDRAMLGYVVDFISVHHGTWYFPAFNVADSAISVGAALLILEALLDGRRKEPESESA